MDEVFFYPGDRVTFVLNPVIDAIVVSVPGNGSDNIRIRWFSDGEYRDDWVRPFEIARREPGKKKKKKKRTPKCDVPVDAGEGVRT